MRVVGVEDRETAPRHRLDDDRLDGRELVQGVDAAQAQMVRGDIGDDNHVVAVVTEALAQDAAAPTSKTAKSTRGFCSTIRADFGPEASALMMSRSSMTTPSVEVIPTLWPRPLKMCAIIPRGRRLPVRPGHGDDRDPRRVPQAGRAGPRPAWR